MTSIDQHDILQQADTLDTMLKTDAMGFRDNYIDNDGFSDRVMARVSIASTQTTPDSIASARRRLIVVSIAAFFSFTLVMLLGAGGNFVIDAVMDLTTQTMTPTAAMLVFLMASVGILGVSAAAGE